MSAVKRRKDIYHWGAAQVVAMDIMFSSLLFKEKGLATPVTSAFSSISRSL